VHFEARLLTLFPLHYIESTFAPFYLYCHIKNRTRICVEERALHKYLNAKDPLLDGSCTWILDDPAFRRWWNDEECQILWIHGDPGKGKTMMMMALIEEIPHRIKGGLQSETMAYFFCQDTVKELNKAAVIVRGLTYLLVEQKPELIGHLRRHYDQRESDIFEGSNAIYELWRTLMEVLEDAALSKVYFLVDALDECDSTSAVIFLKLLLQARSKSSQKVRWIISSRNEPHIWEYLGSPSAAHDTSLELNSTHVAKAVDAFIAFTVNDLAHRKRYAEETVKWVALVCKELEKIPARKALKASRKDSWLCRAAFDNTSGSECVSS
jgi:hypothetical protein